MKLDHVAIWAVDIELLRIFYETYFDARSNLKYENERKRFTSYFLTVLLTGLRSRRRFSGSH